MSSASREVTDLIFEYHQTIGRPLAPGNVVWAYGDPDMCHWVIGRTRHGESTTKYAGGARIQNNIRRINRALQADPRFRKCRIMAYRAQSTCYEYIGATGSVSHQN